nr:hypothetical protein CFP56_21121 [Quercus suber]
MSSANADSTSSRFMRNAGEVNDKRLWGPAKWIVQLIQYLVALVMVTMAEGLKAIFTGEKRRSRRGGMGRPAGAGLSNADAKEL